MDLDSIKNRALKSSVTIGVLGALCLVLAVLQYNWIGELSRGERARLQEGLRNSLQRLADDFNRELNAATAALRPSAERIDELGPAEAYGQALARWRDNATQPNLIRRAAIVLPRDGRPEAMFFNDDEDRFQPAPWPPGWESVRDAIQMRIERQGGGPPPMVSVPSHILEFPRFRGGPGPAQGPNRGMMGEQEWLVVELDLDHIRESWIPQLLARHIGTGTPIAARVFDRFRPSDEIFSTPGTDAKPDASITLLEINRFGTGPRSRPPSRDRDGRRASVQPQFRPAPPPPDLFRGRWQLDVQYAEGSLDTIVNRIRWRNLGISAAILGLLLFTAIVLVRHSREQHKLAELQMNFVAGVSHELRTPLTVIRTAAYNLRGRVAANPAQVERYGALIQDESEKLTALVEQVLRFSSARAGHAAGERSPVAVEAVIEESIQSRRLEAPGSGITVERNIESHLPLVLADELALKHALQNLLDNAVKYAVQDSGWIGVTARKVTGAKGDAVEITIADRGPGVPPDEQADIFHPFVRGRRAQQDQIHGTGLGLNLVKRIVEAHQGEVRLESEPGRGAAFIMKIPAAPAELQDELAHTSG
jgi:signal transduction histidine kinase